MPKLRKYLPNLIFISLEIRLTKRQEIMNSIIKLSPSGEFDILE